ncbi:hypothetical protein ACP70R_019484 [Stipagrostis hirtigluma subsp. patula]
MSRPHDGHRSFFPVGNPFRMIFPRGAHLSPKLTELLASNEDGLALSLRKLKPDTASEVLTLSWMRLAVDCLLDLHTNIASLITELELPISDWDEKWVDIYLNSSVKLLDICIALSSELSRLDQGQLLVQYVLHVLDSGGSMPSQEQLKRAEASLKEWAERAGMRSPRLESCSGVLQELAGNLCLMKVKHSAKGKVLMRALYGIEAVTVFICSVLVAVLSGSSKPLVEFEVPEKFGWSKAFSDLHTLISGELGRQFSCGSVTAIKELEEVDSCARKLHALTNTAYLEVDNANLAGTVSRSKEVIMLQSVTEVGMDISGIKEEDKTVIHKMEGMILERTPNEERQDANTKQASDANTKQASGTGSDANGLEVRKELLNCISCMSRSAEELRLGLDSLSKGVGDFFEIVLTGRDALLCNLRIPDGSKAVVEVRS